MHYTEDNSVKEFCENILKCISYIKSANEEKIECNIKASNIIMMQSVIPVLMNILMIMEEDKETCKDYNLKGLSVLEATMMTLDNMHYISKELEEKFLKSLDNSHMNDAECKLLDVLINKYNVIDMSSSDEKEYKHAQAMEKLVRSIIYYYNTLNKDKTKIKENLEALKEILQ